MTRSIAEVETALSERYAGQIKVVEATGMSYVPWNDSLQQAIKVFGSDGFDITVGQVNQVGEGFMAIVTITVTTSDGRSFSRSNVGYSDIRTTRAGQALIDMAIKAAVSDAISRTLKLFGDAFALFLYDKDDVANTGAAKKTTTSAPRATTTTQTYKSNTGGDLGFRPSDKQLPYLLKAGLTVEQVAEMPFKEWKAALDAYFAGNKKPVLAAVTPADFDEDDDI